MEEAGDDFCLCIPSLTHTKATNQPHLLIIINLYFQLSITSPFNINLYFQLSDLIPHLLILTSTFSCQITSPAVSTLGRTSLTKMSTICFTQPDGEHHHPPRSHRQTTMEQETIFLHQTSKMRKTKLRMIFMRL